MGAINYLNWINDIFIEGVQSHQNCTIYIKKKKRAYLLWYFAQFCPIFYLIGQF